MTFGSVMLEETDTLAYIWTMILMVAEVIADASGTFHGIMQVLTYLQKLTTHFILSVKNECEITDGNN